MALWSQALLAIFVSCALGGMASAFPVVKLPSLRGAGTVVSYDSKDAVQVQDGMKAPCKFEEMQGSVYHYWSPGACTVGEPGEPGADMASFSATFRSVNNDAYTVHTAWCAYSNLTPDDFDEHCVFRSSDYFVGNLDYEVDSASLNDKYKQNVAYFIFQCKNYVSTCQIKVLTAHIAGAKPPPPHDEEEKAAPST